MSDNGPSLEAILAEARKASNEVASWPPETRRLVRAEINRPYVRETPEPEAPPFYWP